MQTPGFIPLSFRISRYGTDDTFCNYSVSRAQLNIALLNAAEEMGGATLW